ncbi:AfsR/SARP family transcriptional regulator [Allorhizocola rhizosphaerae]|uniref:AfsR/SARP family transcriptional regulator n=1 Tax=Allorhizocola rhizosphaerae TaxID=1872709 RepID=UPI0013C2CB20|nr:hypothetical protein [Allorhizocola rhizosphaerae]
MGFWVLGGVAIRVDGRLVPLGARKQRTLTALLLARANTVVPLSEITEELWVESPPRSAAANLRSYAARFRVVLPPAQRDRLVARPLGSLLRVEQRRPRRSAAGSLGDELGVLAQPADDAEGEQQI